MIFETSKDNVIKNPVAPKLPDIEIPFFVQFLQGHVYEVVTSDQSFGSFNDLVNTNSILALPTNSQKMKKRSAKLGDSDRYFPLLRGMVDVPAKGDPVLLTEISGIKYYLGPLNTQNSPNFNTNQALTFEEGVDSANESEVVEGPMSRGESPNFKKVQHHRMMKMNVTELDAQTVIGENHGDLMLEGRHGNSIRIGSRDVNPHIIISNGRHHLNLSEGIADGSLIAITKKGSLQQHFGKYRKMTSKPQKGEPVEIEEVSGFVLGYQAMGSIIGSVNRNDNPNELIYNYGNEDNQNQILINSDRIIINTKREDIYLSSTQDIHIGSSRHTTLSSAENFIVQSDKVYLGDPKDREDKMEPMVLGNQLLEILKEITGLMKTANLYIFCPMPLSSIDELTGAPTPLAPQFAMIEQKLNNIISQHYYVEPNR